LDKPLDDESFAGDGRPRWTLKHDIIVEPPEVPIAVFWEDEVRWDVEFWSEAQINVLLERAEAPFGSPNGFELSFGEIDFLSRLPTARPLSNPNWLAARQQRLEASNFRNLLVQRALYGADAYLDDAAGMLVAGDTVSATLAAREAFGRVIDALLVERGEMGLSPKWRARKLRALASSPLSWDDYWSIETMREYSIERPEEWIEATIAKCRTLMLCVRNVQRQQ
jgi:hypothetical protein